MNELTYSINGRSILETINLQIEPHSFVAIVGENGAGKTTFLDLVMGFRKPTSGTLRVFGQDPWADPWESRRGVSYLSEKVDMQGDWTVREFLDFNRAFYSRYNARTEQELLSMFRVDASCLIGRLSAGELRRAQVVAALSIGPDLVVADEITAVLDITGRKRFLDLLASLSRERQGTTLLATNILEGLEGRVTHIAVLHRGRLVKYAAVSDIIGRRRTTSLSTVIEDMLEGSS